MFDREDTSIKGCSDWPASFEACASEPPIVDRLRAALPGILGTRTDVLFPRLLHIIEDLIADWRRLDERVDNVSEEIEALAKAAAGRERLMTVPGIGPIISSATVAAIGTGDVFGRGRDFGAWLGLVLGSWERYGLEPGYSVRV